MPLGARSKVLLLHYVGSQRAAKLAARGAELEPAPQSLSIFCELVQKGFSTTFATKLLRVPPMPNETELSITMGAHPLVAPPPPAAAAIKAVGGAIFLIGMLLPVQTCYSAPNILFVAAMVTTDGRQELRRRLICCLVVQVGGTREIIRRKRAQRLSHGRLRKLTGKFSASCGQFFVVVRS